MKTRFGTLENWDLVRHKKEGYLRWLYAAGQVRVPGEIGTQRVDLDDFEYAFMDGDVLELNNVLHIATLDDTKVFGLRQGESSDVEQLSQYKLVQRKQ